MKAYLPSSTTPASAGHNPPFCTRQTTMTLKERGQVLQCNISLACASDRECC